MRSAVLLALLATVLVLGTTTATNKHKEKHHPGHHHSTFKRSSEAGNEQSRAEQSQWSVFQQGRDYCFDYNGQIASGYAPWISTQRAMTRLQCKACFSFQQQGQTILRIENVRIGQSNQLPIQSEEDQWNAAEIQDMQAFKQIDRETAQVMKRKLQLPVEFAYIDGNVERILFHADDKPWSKNIKKAVLNLIQLNLKAGNEQQQRDDEQRSGEQRQGSDRLTSTFTITETNIEGVCEATYTVLSSSSSASASISINSNNNRNSNQNNYDQVNVTKSINFGRCEKLADVGYGFQVEPIASVQYPKQRDAAQVSQQQHQSTPSLAEQSKNTGYVVPKEKLDRSTIIRYVLAKKGNGYEIRRVELLSEYTLKSSEAESSQAMQTIATAELTIREGESSSTSDPTNIERAPEKEETLVYNVDAESLEKQFYMYGDERFQGDNIPFPFHRKDSQAIVPQAEAHLRKMCEAFGEDSKLSGGIDTSTSIEHFEKLVQIMRMCSVEELKQLDTKASQFGSFGQQNKENVASDLFADALAVAATRNTITLLTQKIQSEVPSQQMSELKAAQLLKVLGRGAGLPAPSDAQVDAILALCKSDGVQQAKMMLKQSCWLTFGTMVGELNQQTRKAKLMGDTESPLKASEEAEKSKVELYKSVLIEQLTKASDVYEKVLALKCLGNAGLKSSLPELKALLNNRKESPIVRINAVDALRRLRHQLPPQAIQSLVLPIFQNTREQKELRMAAYSMCMQTRPQRAVVDQIAFTMANERCKDVQGFVYSAMKAQAKSPIPEERKSADHLKNALKLAQMDEEQLEAKHTLSSSRRWSSAFYSQEQQEGAFLNTVSMFPSPADSDSALPSHMSMGLDTYFNGHFNRNALKVTLCQKDIEQLARQIFGSEAEEDQQQQASDPNEQQQQPQEPSINNGSQKGGSRKKQGFFSHAAQQLKAIFGKLNIKGRGQKKQEEGQEEQKPYLVLSVRMNDVDVMMVPINMDDKQEGSTISRVKHFFTRTLQHVFSRNAIQRFELNSAIVLNSRQATVPTSVGMSLRISQSMYILGTVKAQAQGERESKVTAKLHPNFNWIQTQKMETRAMTYASGVQSSRAVAINLPMEADFKAPTPTGQESKVQVTLRVPEQRVRLLGAHSLPSTFTEQINDFFRPHNDSIRHYRRVETVHNAQLESQLREVKLTLGKEGLLGLPIKVHGHFHQPRQMFSMKELAKVVMSGDNHVNIYFDPKESSNTPKEIAFTVTANVFQPHARSPATSIRPKLQNFYSKPHPFSQRNNEQQQQQDDSESTEEDQEQQRGNGISSQQQQQKKYNSFLDKFEKTEKRNYKHSLKVVVETAGSSLANKAEATLESVCDSRLRACEASLQVERSPLANEKAPWKMSAQVQTLYPEHVNDVQELLESSSETRQQKFFCHAEAQWGPQRQQQQQIQLNIEGQASHQMLRQIFQSQQQQKSFRAYDDNESYEQRNGNQMANTRDQQRSRRRNQQAQRKIFIDQYQMVADYSLLPSTLHTIQGQLEGMKSRNFWNTKSKLISQDEEQEQDTQLQSSNQRQLSSGQTECTLNIDPVTARHANISIQTPSQRIWMRAVEMPGKLRPMPLVRKFRSSSASHSTRQLVQGMLGQGTQENRAQCKVGMKTVDTFDGVAYRAPMSKCYTVLSKDCSLKEGEPKFAVLMRSLEAGSEEKKIKILANHKVITVRPEGQDRMIVKVDEKTYTIAKGQDQDREEDNQLRANGIECETDYQGRQTVTIDVSSVAVKFNGKTAKIQISEQHKNTQCGLCGNYNDDSEDELRMGNDELTADVQKFHQSYSLKEDGECQEQEHAQFYGQDKAYAFGHKQQPQQVRPVERTVTMEYNHKICFSLRPVKQCPEGWYAGEQQDDQQEQELLKREKVQFSCLDRQSIEAKRLRSVVRRSGVADLSEYAASFVEQVVVPETCTKVQY